MRGENKGKSVGMLTVQFGPFLLDEAQRRLTRNGVEIHLTPKAFDLLIVLVTEAPRVLSKNELHLRVWPGTFVSDATVVGVIKELRRALDGQDEQVSSIRTVNRVGYAFAKSVEPERPGGQVCHWVVVSGRQIVLKSGENRIGRDPASTVWLDSGGVSRNHARIVVAGSDATIEDLGSKNGTSVGGKPVAVPLKLVDADVVEIGPVSIIYRCSTAGLSTEALPVLGNAISPPGRH
jgi:DNA-binding winged helix-turn-helix (wHTH) protein